MKIHNLRRLSGYQSTARAAQGRQRPGFRAERTCLPALTAQGLRKTRSLRLGSSAEPPGPAPRPLLAPAPRTPAAAPRLRSSPPAAREALGTTGEPSPRPNASPRLRNATRFASCVSRTPAPRAASAAEGDNESARAGPSGRLRAPLGAPARGFPSWSANGSLPASRGRAAVPASAAAAVVSRGR